MKKVLIIGNRIPVPVKDGGAAATLQVLELYSKAGFQVDFITLNTKKHFASKELINEKLGFLNKVITFDIDTSIKPFSALSNLIFSSKSYNIVRFISKGFEDLILKQLKAESYDRIHVEGLYSAVALPKIKKVFKGKIYVRTHNIEYEIWQRLSESDSNFLKRFYYKKMSERLKLEEIHYLSFADELLHISQTDMDFFKSKLSKVKHRYLPFVVKVSQNNSENHFENRNTVGFIGSMEWLPNINGVKWFIENVWTNIFKELPNASLNLAGRSMNGKFKSDSSFNIKVFGEVEDSKEFMLNNDILIVPLFSGSGIRIKTLEAMSLGLAVVSTSIGAQGLDVEHGENIMIGNSEEEFASCVLELLKNDSKRKGISKNAFEFVQENHSEQSVISILQELD